MLISKLKCLTYNSKCAVTPRDDSLSMSMKFVMNEPKQLSVSNQHIRVPRLRALKFRFDVCLECEVTVVSKLISKKRVCKSIDSLFKKKNLFNTWIRTCDLLNASQLHYRLSHMAAVFDGMLLEFSPLLHLQATVERKLITTFARGGKLEGGR